MDRFRDVLLDVWREACRHIEIADSTARIAPMLARDLPLACLLVRRMDSERRVLETVALGRPRPARIHAAATTACSEAKWARLRAWAEAGEILHGNRMKRTGDLSLLVPDELDGETLVGPLVGPDGPTGALVLVAESQRSFQPQHLEMLRLLLEPFSAALENDVRLHELAALREAAEADRRSLLTRLGRQEFNEQVVGAETGLKLVMQRVELVAQSDVPVLILGETGTGKEVVSRAIHVRSPRSAAPFIRVNCGAIPPELIDSQLFGHERGSFTGAADQRKGWFERADGGTLFLDEIGELPLPAQVRLLRVLQEHQIERVGGQQTLHVDVRIIAATHRDLASMVKAGTFREDLWYRINVFPILLPRLCERNEDIPALARHFAHRAAVRFGLPEVEPTVADLQLLMSYKWPGNIRELGAVIDRAAILGNGRSLEVAQALGLSQRVPPPVPVEPSNLPTMYEVIPEAAQPLVPTAPAIPLPAYLSAASQSSVSTGVGVSGIGASSAHTAPALSGSVAIGTLDDAMKLHIERALIATRGKIEGRRGAAALLGINPHTLRARMRKLQLDWSRFRDL